MVREVARDAVVGEVGRRAGRGGRPGPAAHLGPGRGRGRGGRRGRRPRPAPNSGCTTARPGTGSTHTGGLSPRRGETPSGPGQCVDRCPGRTRQGLVDGTVSPGQADVIVRAVDDLPSGDLVRRRGEKVLVRQAGASTPPSSPGPGRHLAEVVDPDTVDRRLEAQLEREERAAHLHPLPLDQPGPRRRRPAPGPRAAEDGALLMAALLPLTCPESSHRPSRPRRPTRRPGRSASTAATTAPGSGTPWSPPPSTRSTPACRRRPTAPPPDCLVTLDQQTLKGDLAAAGQGRDHRRRHRTTPRHPPPARL